MNEEEQLTEPSWRGRLPTTKSLAWVPLVASLTSLMLSIGSIIIATRDPAVRLILPDQIRFVQGERIGFAYAYLQPTFVSTGENDRVEVIRDMRLVLTPSDGGAPVEFAWDEVGRLEFDAADDSLTYEYLADPVPLLVAPDAAENPLALFQGPDGWFLEPGDYEVELIATRVVASDGLRATFELTITEEQIAFLDEADGGQFLTLTVSSGP
jgi:hypothetical protein